MTRPRPAAPWSVPSAFSAARRPNSDQTWTSTRSASPRASRSRWKAASASHVSFSGPFEHGGLVGVGVVVARRGDRDAVQRQPRAEHRGQCGEALREVRVRVRRVGDGAGEGGNAVALAQRRQPGAQPGGVHRGARHLRGGGPAAGVRGADPRGRVEHQRLDVAPHVARPEVVVPRLGHRGDRHAAGGERGRERAVEREPLQRVVHRADAVEVAAHPARGEPRVERADLVEVARDEVRLVRVLVADGRQHGDLALGVEAGERRGRRVPAQPPVLPERRAGAGREREPRPQPPVGGVLRRREEGDGVQAAREEDLHEHPPAGERRLRERGLGLERGQPPAAVDGEGEAGGAQQEAAPGEPGAGGRRHPGLDRGQPLARAGARGVGEVAAVVGHQLVCRSGEVAISIRSAFWRRIA